MVAAAIELGHLDEVVSVVRLLEDRPYEVKEGDRLREDHHAFLAHVHDPMYDLHECRGLMIGHHLQVEETVNGVLQAGNCSGGK